jgi:adenosine deaminase
MPQAPQEARAMMKDLPKVELHVHLEGCMGISTLISLADRNGMQLPPHVTQQNSLMFGTFDEFAHTYYSICKALKHEDDFRLLAGDVADYVTSNNIEHCEVSWTPFLYLNRGLRFDAIMHVLNDELETRGVRNRVKFIIDMQRDHGTEAGSLVLSEALHCSDANIVGIGLTGQEAGFRPDAYKSIYQQAREAGLGCTAHAGEYGTPVDIWQCIRELGVTRIGHGIAAANDPDLLDFLAHSDIHLEVCPTSNVRLQRVLAYSTHPFKLLWERGVKIGINSDDPGIFGSDLTSEYVTAMTHFGLTISDLKTTVLNSIKASFATSSEKDRLRTLVEHAWR